MSFRHCTISSKHLWNAEHLLKVLDGIDQRLLQADASTYSDLLQACGKLKALPEGRRVEEQIWRSGHGCDGLLPRHLVEMYLDCGSIAEAERVLYQSRYQDVVLWTRLVVAYTGKSSCREALQIFRRMQQEGVASDKITLVALSNACQNLVDGKVIHARVLESGVADEVIVANAIASMYSKCGSLEDACGVFEKMTSRDLISWNAMVAAYAQHGHFEDGFRVFMEMQQLGLRPNKITFFNALTTCTTSEALPNGKMIHRCISEFGFASDTAVVTALINMYGRCKSIESVRAACLQLYQHDVVSFTAVIAAYAQQHGYSLDAFEAFNKMLLSGLKPDNITFLAILHACQKLEEGRRIHSQIKEMGLGRDMTVGNAVVKMYGKCGNPEESCCVFENLEKQDLLTWNAIATAYCHLWHIEECRHIFHRMLMEGMKPNMMTFTAMLSVASNGGCFGFGKLLHFCIDEIGGDQLVVNNLIEMYSKCGSVEDVLKLQHYNDLVFWNGLMAVILRQGLRKNVLLMYKKMQLEGVLPDTVSLLTALSSCSTISQLSTLQVQIKEDDFERDAMVGTALINVHSRCGRLDLGRKIFERIENKDVVCWNAMITAVINYSEEEGITYYRRMQCEGYAVNRITFVTVLNAYSSVEGDGICKLIRQNGLLPDPMVENAIMSYYCRCGQLDSARDVVEQMQHRCDVVTWNGIIAAYVQCERWHEARMFYKRMQIDGLKPDVVTFRTILNSCVCIDEVREGEMMHLHILESGYDGDGAVRTALLGMYGRCGNLQMARKIFDEMMGDNNDVVVWNAMLCAYGSSNEGVEIVRSMYVEGVAPNQTTLMTVVNNNGLMMGMDMIMMMAMEWGWGWSVAMVNAVVNMYAKYGKLDDAKAVFERMDVRDEFSWNAIMLGYGNNGKSEMVIKLFHRMQQEGVKAMNMSFMIVLCACSHGGLVEEGIDMFSSMIDDHEISPTAEQYACMVDHLGRSGRLKEAEELATRIEGVESGIGGVGWMALLSACRVHDDVVRAKRVARRVLKDDPNNSSAYVVLYNTYAAAGQ